MTDGFGAVRIAAFSALALTLASCAAGPRAVETTPQAEAPPRCPAEGGPLSCAAEEDGLPPAGR